MCIHHTHSFQDEYCIQLDRHNKNTTQPKANVGEKNGQLT